MSLKAQANNLKALSPAHFPAAQPHLHKQLLAISSDTSPVKHSAPQEESTSPKSSPRRPPGLSLDAPKAMAGLAATGSRQLAAGILGHYDANGISHPLPLADGVANGASNSAAIVKMLSGANRDSPADQFAQLHLLQQMLQQHAQSQQESLSQQSLQQAVLQQQQQQQHQQQHVVSGSLFRLQESPMVHRGMVTGSHGYPRAPFSTTTPLTTLDSLGVQQSQPVSQSLSQAVVSNMNGSMQHQQGGFPGQPVL